MVVNNAGKWPWEFHWGWLIMVLMLVKSWSLHCWNANIITYSKWSRMVDDGSMTDISVTIIMAHHGAASQGLCLSPLHREPQVRISHPPRSCPHPPAPAGYLPMSPTFLQLKCPRNPLGSAPALDSQKVVSHFVSVLGLYPPVLDSCYRTLANC